MPSNHQKTISLQPNQTLHTHQIMTKNQHTHILIILILAFGLSPFTLTKGQNTTANAAFKSGELLTYNLYYNWKFIWVKAGSAGMSVTKTTYNGKPAFRTRLTTRGSQRVDDYFVLRDTLTAYTTPEMLPLYYRKGAEEGDRYTVDEAFYTYPDKRTRIKTHKQDRNGKHSWHEQIYSEAVFDMLNLFVRARNFDTAGWKPGHSIKFMLIDGHTPIPAYIRYRSRKHVKGDNGIKYPCLQLDYTEIKDGKEKTIASFFVSDDYRHIPIRIDMNLKFGSAKAFVTGMRGVK